MHFIDNKNEPDKIDENFEWLWKIRTIFNELSDSYAKYYSSTEYAAVDEITMLVEGRVIFKLNVPKKHKRFGIKLYILCDSEEYTYNIHTIYIQYECVLGQGSKSALLQ
jgi:hypothetical protein